MSQFAQDNFLLVTISLSVEYKKYERIDKGERIVSSLVPMTYALHYAHPLEIKYLRASGPHIKWTKDQREEYARRHQDMGQVAQP